MIEPLRTVKLEPSVNCPKVTLPSVVITGVEGPPPELPNLMPVFQFGLDPFTTKLPEAPALSPTAAPLSKNTPWVNAVLWLFEVPVMTLVPVDEKLEVPEK